MKGAKNQKGFTLVELIIVIAIIGILSAAAIPRVVQYVDKARISADMQTAAAFESSIEVLLAGRELRVVSGTSLYIMNEGAALDIANLDKITISNSSNTVGLDIHVEKGDIFIDANGKTISAQDVADLFNNSVKISSFKYYNGMNITLGEKGTAGYSFVE